MTNLGIIGREEAIFNNKVIITAIAAVVVEDKDEDGCLSISVYPARGEDGNLVDCRLSEFPEVLRQTNSGVYGNEKYFVMVEDDRVDFYFLKSK